MARRAGQRDRLATVLRHAIELEVSATVDHVSRVHCASTRESADSVQNNDVLWQVSRER